MLGWLYRLIIGRFSNCDHEWEIIKTYKIADTKGRHRTDRHLLSCKKCGELKHYEW